MSDCDSSIRFGAYRASPTTAELFRGRKKISIQEKPFRALMILLQRAGELVSRDELRASLWPDMNVELDLCLNTAMHKLRLALGDDPTAPRYIRTYGANGYRFIGRIKVAKPGQADALRPASTQIRIAVIPFETLTNKGGEHFAYSMAEQVITRIGNNKEFRVFAPPSIKHYKHGAKTVPQLCRELHSDYLLCGAVLRKGSRFRLYVRLLRGSDQCCIWTNEYVSDDAESFETHDTITENIVEGVSSALGLCKGANVVRDRERSDQDLTTAGQPEISASELLGQ